MDRRDAEKRRDHPARDKDRALSCPACAAAPTGIVVIVDTRKGKTIRLFECRCGELVWDD